jgi:hemerythrin-like metal-binding protein
MVIPQTLIWTEKLSMFNEKLDTQHKTLFGYINQIIQLEQLYPKSGQFAEILSMITDYGLEHLKTEERLMMDMHYPKAYFDLHQAEHKSYIFEVAMFNTNFLQPDHTEPREVINFLKSWWSNHILRTDMHFSLFIRKILSP